MGVVTIKCPASGRAVSTGIEVDAKTFRGLPDISSRMHCPDCNDNHVWRRSEAWLAEEAVDPG